MKTLAGTTLFLLALTPSNHAQDIARQRAEAARVTIVRDDWGIAHIHGHTDADAVFGMIYAQCEDDFNRVEMNYLTALGRTAEAEGEAKIWQDLRQRLFLDPEDLKKDYARSPEWLRQLMDAWADGIDFYLATHPDVKPKVLTHFEPWMALSFTEGSVGGDIERVDLKKLQAFYDDQSKDKVSFTVPNASEVGPGFSPDITSHLNAAFSPRGNLSPGDNAIREPGGSNGIAIAPSNTRDHHALLLINPHTSFFFRSELQMSSDEGLNAYGAVTWGQFFIYQGFNARAGWMHTSSNVDAVDEFVDTLYPPAKGGGPEQQFAYRYGNAGELLRQKQITLSYKATDGLRQRTFTTFYDRRGPIVRRTENNKWISISLMNIPIPALEQSYLRTKATSYAEYKKTMALMANSSNNTIFADADGDIAYWHGNFIPRRDTTFDFTKPVDGSNPATDWHGLLTLEEVPHLLNPTSGYLFNVNDSPWNGAGASSLKQSDYPVYVEQGIESARGLHAMRVLAPAGRTRKDFTLDSLLASAFDSFLPWFDVTLPRLFAAYDALPADAPERTQLAPQMAVLRTWDKRWSADSIPTSLAVFWGTELLKSVIAPAREAKLPTEQYVATKLPPAALLDALTQASAKLTADFGSWQTPWGQINRFQRITGDIVQPFNDAGPSIPVPFTSAIWGSLASFGARQYPDTRKWYGTSGNSFVAVVEFGPRVRARAVTAGGESGHPASPHFNDEAQRYASGNLREVYFYPDQLQGHTECTYHPGDVAR